ncbi:hypothetical protein M9H77_06744 [Catharanthus roseus]|uniref:Uncharacterized protein n=1 Tax=Catharanthus roseus TaxID=4058 RepID=A0ACC0BT74_CATRO|nr:hypothetical protein M9H77_06744 [Catharanthus roseus]
MEVHQIKLQGILNEEAEMFVLKMWRMLIFEIKRVETGYIILCFCIFLFPLLFIFSSDVGYSVGYKLLYVEECAVVFCNFHTLYTRDTFLLFCIFFFPLICIF